MRGFRIGRVGSMGDFGRDLDIYFGVVNLRRYSAAVGFALRYPR